MSSSNGSSSETKRIERKFAHLSGRIGRIAETTDNISENRSKLLIFLSELVPEYQNKFKLFENKVYDLSPLHPNFGNSTPCQNSPSDTSDNIHVNSFTAGVSNQISMPGQSSNFSLKSVPIYK